MQKGEILSVLKALHAVGGSDKMENIVKCVSAASSKSDNSLGTVTSYNPKAREVAQELHDLGFIVGFFDQLTTPVEITASGIKFLQDNSAI